MRKNDVEKKARVRKELGLFVFGLHVDSRLAY